MKLLSPCSRAPRRCNSFGGERQNLAITFTTSCYSLTLNLWSYGAKATSLISIYLEPRPLSSLSQTILLLTAHRGPGINYKRARKTKETLRDASTGSVDPIDRVHFTLRIANDVPKRLLSYCYEYGHLVNFFQFKFSTMNFKIDYRKSENNCILRKRGYFYGQKRSFTQPYFQVCVLFLPKGSYLLYFVEIMRQVIESISKIISLIARFMHVLSKETSGKVS